jgi:hypothetical protein
MVRAFRSCLAANRISLVRRAMSVTGRDLEDHSAQPSGQGRFETYVCHFAATRSRFLRLSGNEPKAHLLYFFPLFWRSYRSGR